MSFSADLTLLFREPHEVSPRRQLRSEALKLVVYDHFGLKVAQFGLESRIEAF